MTPRDFYTKYLKNDRSRIETVVDKAGTNFRNFQQIAICNGSVSRRLAAKLADASNGEMTEMEILFPEKFDGNEAA